MGRRSDAGTRILVVGLCLVAAVSRAAAETDAAPQGEPIRSAPSDAPIAVPSTTDRVPDSDDPDDRRAGVALFPLPRLFAAPLADPRWPRFAVGYQRYLDDTELRNVAAVSFGESFPIVGGPAPFSGRWEFGIQGGVFSIFDFDSESFDLVNSDFLGGLTGAYRRGRFSTLLRFFHQSSHLGDEYLLRNTVNRVNLSYEEINLLVGIDLLGMFRLAAGGGYIVHREPGDLAPGSVQVSLNFEGPWTFAAGHLRPIGGVDLQFREESDWSVDRSVVAGLQLEGDAFSRFRMQGLIEYYGGSSPNGQFYVREIEYIGFSLRLVY